MMGTNLHSGIKLYEEEINGIFDSTLEQFNVVKEGHKPQQFVRIVIDWEQQKVELVQDRQAVLYSKKGKNS
jgi:hypothetical protein